MRLNKSNFELFAAKNYDNPHCESDEEFKEDLLHFKYLKRLVSQYVTGGKLNDRLIMNHLIIINNLFSVSAGTEMVLFKMRGHEDVMKPFLLALNTMPQRLVVNGDEVSSDEIPMDPVVVDTLRKSLR
jgi:hypothetical protein